MKCIFGQGLMISLNSLLLIAVTAITAILNSEQESLLIEGNISAQL